MKVLSLFDGISVAQQALKELGVKDLTYYASEIDKYAIATAKKNHPDMIHIGKVEDLHYDVMKLEGVELIIFGSPCQDLSIAKKDRKGLSGARSGLFYEAVRILKEVKPKYFVMENVNSMPKEAKEQITEILGVEPIMINAALVSAQNRKRLFWTNIPGVTQPQDAGILLRDVLEENVEEKYYASQQSLNNNFRVMRAVRNGDDKSKALTATMWKGNGNDGMTNIQVALNKDGSEKEKSNTIRTSGKGSGIDDKHNWDTIRVGQFGKGGQGDRVYSLEGKSVALSANGGGRGAKTGLYQQELRIRKLTPIECERLQSLPDNYTDGVSNTQRYKMCGNAFNCEVVKHILKNII